jgi:hypothetical protein
MAVNAASAHIGAIIAVNSPSGARAAPAAARQVHRRGRRQVLPGDAKPGESTRHRRDVALRRRWFSDVVGDHVLAEPHLDADPAFLRFDFCSHLVFPSDTSNYFFDMSEQADAYSEIALSGGQHVSRV